MSAKTKYFLVLALLSWNYLGTVDSAGKIDGVVRRNLEKFPTTSVLVQFGAQHIGRAIESQRVMRRSAGSAKLTGSEATAYIDNLNRVANEYQASVLAYLKSGACRIENQGELCRDIDYHQLYISNEIMIRNADRALINRIASMPNVTDILPDEHAEKINLCGGTATTEAPIPHPPNGYHLDMLQVKHLWDRGFTGQGVIVGIADSGMSIEHPTVLRHNFMGSNNYGWFDVSEDKTMQPADGDVEEGHGTCVLSLAVGGNDDAGKHVGVAPGARWIGCKRESFNSQSASRGATRKCMEWLACPTRPDGTQRDCNRRPHVVNHSVGWSFANQLDPNYHKVYEDLDVVLVQAAGNAGPECSGISADAQLSWPIVVGCVDETRRAVEYSSRGPTRDGKIRPHLMAPGHRVRCLQHKKGKDGKWFRYGDGTSTAAPLITGMVALLLSFRPLLTGIELKSMIIRGSWYNYTRKYNDQSCGGRLFADTPNNVYGYGISNAHEAYCLAKKGIHKSIEERLGQRPQRFESPCD